MTTEMNIEVINVLLLDHDYWWIWQIYYWN